MVEDQELVGRTQRGDLSAFEELVRRHQVYIKNVVARRVPSSAIEDVTHNAFWEGCTSLSKFRNEKDAHARKAFHAVKVNTSQFRRVFGRKALSFVS